MSDSSGDEFYQAAEEFYADTQAQRVIVKFYKIFDFNF